MWLHNGAYNVELDVEDAKTVGTGAVRRGLNSDQPLQTDGGCTETCILIQSSVGYALHAGIYLFGKFAA